MVSRINIAPDEVTLAGIRFKIARDRNTPLYKVQSLDLPQLLQLPRGRTALDSLGRRAKIALFDDSVLGFGDALPNHRRSGVSVHRTMNMDTSNGYLISSPDFFRANTTTRTGTVTGFAEIAYNSNPAIIYTGGYDAIRITPAGTETSEQSFSYTVSDAALFDARMYACFDTNDNIWRRTISGTTITWDRQAGTTTAISTEAIAAAADDVDETTAAGLSSLTATTVQTGRLANTAITTESVGQSSDDAHEQGGTVNISASTYGINGTVYGGFRFTTVPVPQGATIISASMIIEINAAATGGGVTIRGQAADNPITFTTATSNISSRSQTSASVAWTVPAGGAGGDRLTTSDITTVVQEIVNRSGWATNNAMVFILLGTGGGNLAVFRTYDNAAGDAAQLDITYKNEAQLGLRFTTVPVPQGAIIDSASLVLMASANDSNTVVQRIYGVAADNPATFSATNKPSGQSTTTAFIDWSRGTVVADTAYTSSDISTVVQEIVNRSGYANNNAMAFVIRNGSANAASISHTWYSFDHTTGQEPRLDITYSTSSVASIKARRFGVTRDALYRIYSANQISKCPTGSSPFEPTAWSAPTGVGTSSSVSTTDWAGNWIGGLGDQLLVMKGDGLFRFNDATGRFDPLTPELASSADTLNGQPCFIWKNVLFISMATGRLLAYDGERIDDVTPLRGTRTTADTAVYGRITAMAGDEQYIYAATDQFHLRTQTGVNLSLDVTTDDAASYTSYATNISDDDPTTTATLSSLDTSANGDWFVIGSDVTFQGIYLKIGTANSSTASMTVEYWNGAWTAVTGARDDTSVSSVTLKQDGAIWWTAAPTDWIKSTINSKSRYWARFSVSAALSTCTLTEAYIIPLRDKLPTAKNGTYTDLDQAGVLAHILKGRLRREGEDIEGSIVWSDFLAVPDGPIDKMYITPSALGFRNNGRRNLWLFARRVRAAVSLPDNEPIRTPYYMAKNANSNDGDKSDNVVWLTAADAGGEAIWHSITVEGRNIQTDDLIEAWYRVGDLKYDDVYHKLNQSPTSATFALSSAIDPDAPIRGRYLEAVIAFDDNDNNDREPPVITRITADCTPVPDQVDLIEFTVELSDFPQGTGMPQMERTADEIWDYLLSLPAEQLTPMQIGDKKMNILILEAERQMTQKTGDTYPTWTARVQAVTT